MLNLTKGQREQAELIREYNPKVSLRYESFCDLYNRNICPICGETLTKRRRDAFTCGNRGRNGHHRRFPI